MDRRSFIRLAGGGVIAASAAGCSSELPAEAVQAWAGPSPQETDLRRWALGYAVLAPHSHNLQSWLVDLRQPGELLLRCDLTRLLPETDPFSRQIMMSHGTFLELLDIAARERGHRAQVELFPTTVTLSPDGEWAYVANSDFHGERPRVNPVSIIHAPTMTKVTDLTACDMPHGVKVNHAGTRVYVSCMHSDEILELDPGSFDIVRRVKLGMGHQMPAGAGGHAGHGPPGASAPPAPPRKGQDVPPTADLSKECAATFVSVSPDDSRLYVACNYGNELQVYDAASLKLVKALPLGAGAYNVEPSPDGSIVIVTNKKDQSVSIVDAKALTELTGVMQARRGTPSMCTVHAPHIAIPHPNFVPVSARMSRRTQRSGVSSSTSTVCAAPLIESSCGMFGLRVRTTRPYSRARLLPITGFCYLRQQ